MIYQKLMDYIVFHKSHLECIHLGEKQISMDSPTFIVAEAACNHMCDLDLAVKMIDEAAAAGADAIKFQTYKAEKLVGKDAKAFWGNEVISQLEYYKKLDRFERKDYEHLFRHAEGRGILAFSSPFDRDSTDMLADIGMPVFKIASCDIPDTRHLKHVASFERPIMLSTGASTAEEIDIAVKTIFDQGNFQLMLLACTLSYPTRPDAANLSRIRTLADRYPGIVIGLSDHTEPDEHMVIPSVAVALGARVIEKHFTLDRKMTGSGHFFAVTPEDLGNMVKNIRLAEKVLGNGDLGVSESEKKAWQSARRSIVAEIPIARGTVITSEMLGMKRPAAGLSPAMIDYVLGKRAKMDIAQDQPITTDLLESD